MLKLTLNFENPKILRFYPLQILISMITLLIKNIVFITLCNWSSIKLYTYINFSK